MSRRVWEAVEAKARETRMVEAKRRREEERGRRETRRKQEEENKKEKALEVKKVAEEWEIWDKEEKVTRSEEKAKKLVPEQSHKWIKVFEKKASERMLTRKIWDYAIDLKERFVLRKFILYSEKSKKK